VTSEQATPSPRKSELLEKTYAYVLENGLSGLSLRPLAHQIGSSPRVLLFCFGSKDGLVRAVLGRARVDELALIESLVRTGLERDDDDAGLEAVCSVVWGWLSDARHRPVLCLWVEAYARSLSDPEGPWSDWAADSVRDWLDVLAAHQPVRRRRTAAGLVERTRALALLRGGLLDLLATGDRRRVTKALVPVQPKR
jgi:AcrR family transcriptional regulator